MTGFGILDDPDPPLPPAFSDFWREAERAARIRRNRRLTLARTLILAAFVASIVGLLAAGAAG